MAKDQQHIGEEEMQRYLNGEMSSEEQHLFESKLENDPFTYTAIEGLENQSKAERTNALEQMQLEVKRSEENFGWMKVAAVVAAVAMAGLGIWYYGQWATPEQIAYKDAASSPESHQPKSPNKEITSQETVVDELQEIPEGETSSTSGNSEVMEEIDGVTEVVSTQTLAQKEAEDQHIQENMMITDLEEAEALESDVMVIEETVSTFDEQITQDLAITQAAPNESVLGRTAPAPDARSMSRHSLKTSSPRPVSGNEAYQQYLTDSLRYAPAMEAGIVTLQFIINTQGRPQQIRVIRSLNQLADQEAIRLLNEGPDWNGTAGIPTTLSIPFKPR